MEAAFDHIAQGYDQEFTYSAIGVAQREQVWHFMPEISAQTTCLELNCGTGEDAISMARLGASVWATDVSEQMVAVAQEKLSAFPKANSKVLDLRDVHSVDLASYNLLFSNFGGLNCLSPAHWRTFAEHLDTCRIGTSFVFVIMGRNCWWERLYFFLTQRKPWSRKGMQPVSAKVGDEQIDTWYYSPKEIVQFMPKSCQLHKLRPVGFAVPPSYLESWFSKKKTLLKLLKLADKHFFSFKFWAPFADHFYIEFIKQ